MTIKEARKLYLQYHGNLFEMSRDDAYKSFQQLSIAPEQIEGWQMELAENYEKILLQTKNAFCVIRSAYEYDSISMKTARNKKFLLDYFMSNEERLDDFTRLLFCEILLNSTYRSYNAAYLPKLYSIVDDLLLKLEKGDFVIDASFKTADDFCESEDFTKEELNGRLKRLKDKDMIIGKKKNKKSIWNKIFKNI